MNFTISNLKTITTDISEALNEVALKYNIKFDMSNITYSQFGFSIKLNEIGRASCRERV